MPASSPLPRVSRSFSARAKPLYMLSNALRRSRVCSFLLSVMA